MAAALGIHVDDSNLNHFKGSRRRGKSCLQIHLSDDKISVCFRWNRWKASRRAFLEVDRLADQNLERYRGRESSNVRGPFSARCSRMIYAIVEKIAEKLVQEMAQRR